MRTFFSCAIHASLMFGSRARRHNVFAKNSSHLCVMSLLGVPVSRFPPIASSPTCCHDLQPRPHRWLEPEVPSALQLHGVECLAIWPIRLQTQVMSPSSALCQRRAHADQPHRKQQGFLPRLRRDNRHH